MEDTETPRMRKYGESKTTRIMMATVPHVTSGSGLRKFQADGFLFDKIVPALHFIIIMCNKWICPTASEKKNYPFNETVTRIPQHMQGI